MILASPKVRLCARNLRSQGVSAPQGRVDCTPVKTRSQGFAWVFHMQTCHTASAAGGIGLLSNNKYTQNPAIDHFPQQGIDQ